MRCRFLAHRFRRFLTRLIRRFRRRPVQRLTGVYSLRPHHTIFHDIPVRARDARRLRLVRGDRLEFAVSPRTGFAKRVRCYKRRPRP